MGNSILQLNEHKNGLLIDIVGAGAMGLLFAARLKLAGHKVRLWCRTAVQASHLRDKGFYFEETLEPNSLKLIRLDAVNVFDDEGFKQLDPSDQQAVGMSVITIKQSSFEPAFIHNLATYKSKTGCSSFIFIQNGVGHLEKVREVLGGGAIIQAVTSEAALLQDSGVAHTGFGITYLSHIENYEAETKIVEECFNNAGIQSFVSKSINEYVYRKLIVNAVINPLTALFRVENGLLPFHPARYKLMERLYEESKFIIERTTNVQLDITFDDILSVCEKTAKNKSSMLTDVLNGRITEIEAINGAIVNLATKHHMKAPINETVYLLILSQHP